MMRAGVYSFCMCPGGYIVPASTDPERLVINGMSLSKRGSAANSGLVVTIDQGKVDRWAHDNGRAGPDRRSAGRPRLPRRHRSQGVHARRRRLRRPGATSHRPCEEPSQQRTCRAVPTHAGS